MNVYTVTAVDEFGREYFHSYVENSYAEQIRFSRAVYYSVIMQQMVGPILKKMGEDAHAEWEVYSYEFGNS